MIRKRIICILFCMIRMHTNRIIRYHMHMISYDIIYAYDMICIYAYDTRVFVYIYILNIKNIIHESI